MTLSVIPAPRLHHIVCADGMIRIAPIRVRAQLAATRSQAMMRCNPLVDALTTLAMTVTAFYVEYNIAWSTQLRSTLYNANSVLRGSDEALQRATLILLVAMTENTAAMTDDGVMAAVTTARRVLNATM